MSETISQLATATQANASDILPATQSSVGPGTGTTRGVTQAQLLAAGGPMLGVTTNSNAAAGYIGEYISDTVSSGAALSLTTATPLDITSISLTAGDWDVWGTVAFVVSVNADTLSCGIGSASATLPAATTGARNRLATDSSTAGSSILPTGTTRKSLASTTTVYLVAQADFGGGTVTAYGFIGARRVR